MPDQERVNRFPPSYLTGNGSDQTGLVFPGAVVADGTDHERHTANYPYPPGTFTVFGEGHAEGLSGYGAEDLDAFVSLLREGGWDGTSPITLIASETGRAFARRLARRLPEVEVFAPTGTVWVTRAGRTYVGGTEFNPDGSPRFVDPGSDDRWVSYRFTRDDRYRNGRVELRRYPRSLPHEDGEFVGLRSYLEYALAFSAYRSR